MASMEVIAGGGTTLPGTAEENTRGAVHPCFGQAWLAKEADDTVGRDVAVPTQPD